MKDFDIFFLWSFHECSSKSFGICFTEMFLTSKLNKYPFGGKVSQEFRVNNLQCLIEALSIKSILGKLFFVTLLGFVKKVWFFEKEFLDWKSCWEKGFFKNASKCFQNSEQLFCKTVSNGYFRYCRKTEVS